MTPGENLQPGPGVIVTGMLKPKPSFTPNSSWPFVLPTLFRQQATHPIVICRHSRINLETRNGGVGVERCRAALAARAAAGLAIPVLIAPGAAPDLAVVIVRQEDRRRRVRRRKLEPARLGLIEFDGGEERGVDLVATVVVQGHEGTGEARVSEM